MVKAPKWYLNDSGLMAFLCGLNPKTVLEAHPLRGPIFETFLVQNIAALMGNHLPEAKLLHYRSHSGHEVDVVIETPQALVAVEAKAGAAVDLRDLRGLSAFLAAEPHCRAGIVAYTGQEIRPLGPRMWAVPVGQVLS